MVDKVKTAIFGKDLRVTLKNYPISESGNKIEIVPSGAGYFMPDIGPNTFLDWPTRKRYILFGKQLYTRIFFALKKGAKCVDFFPEGLVYGPDPEQLKQANAAALAKDIGKDADKGTPWYIWFILMLNIVIFILSIQIAGVI